MLDFSFSLCYFHYDVKCSLLCVTPRAALRVDTVTMPVCDDVHYVVLPVSLQ